jgi:hypothetical protein
MVGGPRGAHNAGVGTQVGRVLGTTLALLTLAGPAAHGCGGSSDCTETLTCADTDGAPGDAFDAGESDSGTDVFRDAPFDSFVLPEGSDGYAPDGCSPGENCTNGIDDNCDGLVDCADPLCTAGYSCNAQPPVGWQGPIELYAGMAPPQCATPYANDVLDGNEGLNAPSAQCSCACGAVGGADCSGSVDWTVYSDLACSTPCATGVMPPNNGNFCESTNGCSRTGSFEVVAGAPLLNVASCSPAPSTKVPPYTWSTIARACGYSGPTDTGGCTGGDLCLAKPSSPFGPRPCIWQTGSTTCPNGPYSQQQIVYGGASDGRGCTQCTCGSPTGVTCNLNGSLSTYAVFGSPCSNLVATATPGGGCVTIGGMFMGGAAGIQGSVSATPQGGSCQASSVTATGTATPSMPTTVCCAP